MPIYEFYCADCGERFEELHRSYDVETAPCPVCGKDAPRQVSNTSFILKGGGWYVTDYGSRASAPAPEKKNGDGASDTPSTPKAKDAATSPSQ